MTSGRARSILGPGLATLVVALLTAGPVSAGDPRGINLSWSNCSEAGDANRDFSCDTSLGGHDLVVSFVAPPGVTAINGANVRILVSSTTPVGVPDWWRLNTCRAGALSASVSSTGLTGCSPFWPGTVIVANPFASPDPNDFIRISLALAIPAGDELPLVEGQEYFLARISISNLKTTGGGACAGCDSVATLALQVVELTQPAGTFPETIAITQTDFRSSVTWQDSAVPVRTSTWGLLKQLYR